MSVTKMNKNFLVSTADVAFFYNDVLAFSGKTSLNTSISVSMEEEKIQGGKGNKTLYIYKYGREMEITIEMAEWNLAFIAANVGSVITENLYDVFSIAECVEITNGIGTLNRTPVGKVFAEDADGNIYTIAPVGNTISIDNTNITKVYATYQYNFSSKRIIIDADSSPFVGKLVLSADKHSNTKGKVGEIQIEIPSYQLSGNFDISLESAGVTSLEISGNALAVDGDSCDTGAVYAYITEIPLEEKSYVTVVDISAAPSNMVMTVGDAQPITVIGIKDGLQTNVFIDADDKHLSYVSGDASIATVDADGVVTAVAVGSTNIYVNYYYSGQDYILVTVVDA